MSFFFALSLQKNLTFYQATTTLTSTILLWAYSRRFPLAPPIRTAFSHVLAMVGIQASLGIATLLYYVVC